MCAVVLIKNAGKISSLDREPDKNNEAFFYVRGTQMDTTLIKTSVTIVLIVSLVLSLCGCGSENQKHSDSGLELSHIYGAALGGALIGGIIGYQSDETGEGVALGAAIIGVGELLRQTDRLAQKEREKKLNEKEVEHIIINIHNSNGSITPVELWRDGSAYIGPKDERYEELPTEEQLKPIYGL